MFVVATTDIIYTYYLVFGKLFIGGVSFDDLRPKYWLYVTNKYKPISPPFNDVSD